MRAAMADQPPPDTTTDAPERPTDAEVFRLRMMGMIEGLGREGVNHALETLFAISDLVLDNQYCAQHTVRRIRLVLDDVVILMSSSEEESAENGQQ